MSVLGNNPLLKEDPVLTEKDVETIKAAREEFTTASFKVRKTLLHKLRSYAFTERMEIKEALDLALSEFLDKVKDEDLIEYREKIKRRK